MKHIASCSFGKDSIATILLAIENNDPLGYIAGKVEVLDGLPVGGKFGYLEETLVGRHRGIKPCHTYARCSPVGHHANHLRRVLVGTVEIRYLHDTRLIETVKMADDNLPRIDGQGW